MNGFRIARKKKLTAEQGAALAVQAATHQALPALVGAKWALIASFFSLALSIVAVILAATR